MKDRKTPVIILHGWNLSGDRFSPLKKKLEREKHFCLCPDLPGFGKSIIDRPYGLSDYTVFLKKYVKEKRLKKFVLIGHSFGGRVGIKYAAENPDSVKTLILTGVPGYVPVRRGKILFFEFLSKFGKVIFRLPFLSRFQNSARLFLYRAAKSKDYLKAGGFLKSTFMTVIRENLHPLMIKISSPTVLVWGSEDKTVPVRIAEKMKNTIPDSILIILPRENHRVPYQAPGEFYNAIKKFI